MEGSSAFGKEERVEYNRFFLLHRALMKMEPQKSDCIVVGFVVGNIGKIPGGPQLVGFDGARI